MVTLRDVLRRFGQELSQQILAQVSVMLAEREPVVARDGTVIANSYNPADGTVEVVFGDTAANIGDDGDSGVTIRVQAPGTAHPGGDQYGYVGGERVWLIPAQSGYAVLGRSGPDDSPNAPLGERWVQHRNQSGPDGFPYQGPVDVSIKLANNGAPNDGLGGLAVLAGSLFKLTTGGGHKITADDGNQFVEVATSGGNFVKLDDANKRVTASTAASSKLVIDDTANTITLSIGSLELVVDNATGKISLTNGGTADPIVTLTHLQSALNAFALLVQSGPGVTAPTATGSAVLSGVA